MKKKSLKMLLCGAAVLTVAMVGFQPVEVQANMGNYNYVSIDSGVVDSITVNGVTVNALYRKYDSSVGTDTTYSCAAFVKRFYSAVYGRNVWGLMSTTSVPSIDSGSFRQTYSPKVGDIIRDNVSVHWAIVKEVNGNTITVIQQSAWDRTYTKAWVGATIENGDSRYSFFTWDGNKGGAATSSGNYSIDYMTPQVQDTNATVSGSVNNPNRSCVKQVGINLWDANMNLVKRHTESCWRPESRFNMWYDIQAELGITLKPGTTYKYQFYVVHDGQQYPGNVQTFTTLGTASNTNTNAASEDEVYHAITKVHELYSWKRNSNIENALGEAKLTQIKKSNVLYHYPVNTLLNRNGKIVVETKKDKVKKVSWIYEYKDSSKTSKKDSEALYYQICKVADKVVSADGVGSCTSRNNLTTKYGDGLKIKKDVNKKGKPYVSIIVSKDFGYELRY